MKKILLFSFIALTLSGCGSQSIQDYIVTEAPLSKTLDEIKKELSAFQYEVDQSGLQFSCSGKPTQLAKDLMKIPQVEVSVSVANSKSSGTNGGILIKAFSLGGDAANEQTNKNSLKLVLIPDNDLVGTAANHSKKLDNGIADNLFAVVEEFAKANNQQPCLKGSASELTLGFEIKQSETVTGGVDLVVIKVGATEKEASSFANQIKVIFDFGGGATLI